MTPSILGQATLQAIKCLKESGEKSFEKLTATLLSLLIGFPIRLCKSGYQAGIDAMADPAEIPVAIEDKRYQSGTLDLDNLRGKLAAAAQTYPDLQLWVLATTVEVSPLQAQALRNTGESLGLAVLILDSAAAQPQFPEIASIVALCASAPDETLNAISTPAWLDAKLRVSMPSIDMVRDELETIRAQPQFTEWLNRFCAKLTDLPLWSLVANRQNRRLSQILEADADTIFGTDFDPNKLVPRTVKSELNTWFAAAMATSEPKLAVILGERYDGKTWLVFDWLRDTIATLPVPVFVVGSKRGKSSTKDLADHILEDIKRVLGSFERHASTTLKRQRDTKAGSAPWCVIILDGLNEYAPNPDQWLAHLSWATGRTDLDARTCAVIATVRQRSWQELADLVRGGVQEIQIGPYDNAEFRVALKLQELPADYLQAIPENAREMVRRPRYFDLVIKHKDKLGRYDAITPEVLGWLDLCDKIRSKRAPASGWDEQHFQGVLKELAARYISSRSLQLREVRSLIGEFASDIEAILHDLRSEGVLIETGTGYRLSAERFVLGRGLYLLEEELCTTYELGEDLDECLRDSLATLRETKEMIACLRAAVIVALFSDPLKPEAVIDVLVHEWLGSRNLSDTDFQEIRALHQEIRALHHRLLHPLLRLAPKVWSAKRDEEGLQELSRMVFIKALANHRHLIGDAIRSWFRLVPTAGSAPFQGRMEEPTAEIRDRTADPNLTDLHLKEHGDEGILMLQRVGLYLLSKVPELVGPDDLLALMAAQEIAGDYPRDGDCFVIRRILAHTSVTWFEEQMRRLSRDPTGRRREILYWLITCAAREDLQAFEEATKPATDPWQELRYQFSLYDRARYDELRARSFSADEAPAQFVELARDVVRDPDLPKPCQERISAISQVLLDTFSKAALLRESFSTAEDYKFEEMLHAVAAWVPDIGAAIVRQQIEGLPTCAPDKQHGWAFRLDQDAVLADGLVRSALLTLLSVPSTTDEARRALDRILGALLPGMQPRERIDALIDLPPDCMEWTDLYRQLVADLMNTDEVAYALSRWRHEGNPLYRRRLLRLLARTRHLELTASEIERLANDIANGNDEDRFYALFVAVTAQVKTLPLEILLPLATKRNNPTSRIPDYAAWLVVHGNAFAHTTYKDVVEQLPLQWRALAATKKADLGEIFLQEVEQVLGNDSQVAADLARRTQEHRNCWSSHEFPRVLIAQMCEQNPARFEAWMDALLADKRRAKFGWGGIRKPMFQVAIRTAHPRTKELWPLVFPFQRGPVAIETMARINGINWAVHELSHPSAHEGIASDLLTDLVCRSLSDWELFQITLGARHQSQARLFRVVKALLGNSDAEIRARAVRIAGWLEGLTAECAEVERSDRSLWVRRVAMLALETAQVETWARRWFDTFLNGANPATRWGGGQLFLTCVDGRFRAWAWSLVNQPGLAARVRGEAILLLNAADQSSERKDRALQETFLGHKVANLRAVCHPWYPEVDWEELETTR